MSMPVGATRITVRGTFVDALGSPVRGGEVFFRPSFPNAAVERVALLVIGAGPVVAYTDELGQFSVQLWATDDERITPTGFTYLVVDPTGRHYHIPVPMDSAAGALDLADVVPVSTPNPGNALLLTGPAGVDGAAGPAGADSTVPGPTGPRGKQVEAFTGSEPSLSGRVVGDLAINADTGELIRAKEA